MGQYLLKRVLLIIPTMFGIMLISFAIIQFAPGGPVERVIAQITGTDVSATARIGGSQGDGMSGQSSGQSMQSAVTAARNTAARRGSTPSSSRAWRSSSALTSRRTSASS